MHLCAVGDRLYLTEDEAGAADAMEEELGEVSEERGAKVEECAELVRRLGEAESAGAEASAGACDLIKSVADELAPRYADLYLLESVEAAVGIATDRLREEFGAAVLLKAQARVVLDRIRYCYRGNRAADARRHLQQAWWRSRAAHARCHGRPRGRYSLLHRRP